MAIARSTPRVCFLFNHDQTHQLAHSLPIALELIASRRADVTLAVTSPVVAEAVRAAAGDALEHATLVSLGPTSFASRTAVAALEWLVPARKLSIYGDNLEFFRSFDALVVAEKSSLLLKSHYGLDHLKVVHTRHGAGDRAIGFNRESADFDLILAAGPKIRDRLVADAGVDPDRIRIVGYSKFDLHASHVPDLPLARNGRPTIVYNPHPSPKLSSWYKWGNAVLEAFASSEKYNLVFAPHVMLFERRVTVTIDPPAIARVPQPHARYGALPHMLIDRGSEASTDMTYTQAADLYLGDVSSQVYEFLVRPRPCVFLNAHQTPFHDDPSYAHWRAGPVIDRIDDLMATIDHAFAHHDDYRGAQQALLDATFSMTDTPACVRAADAIMAMLSRGDGKPG